MSRNLDTKKIDAALKEAAVSAKYGTREDRSGRFLPIKSSVITSIEYDEDTAELDVTFSGGKIYRYFDVPLGIYAEFLDAASKGAFFNDSIKDTFRFAEVSNGDKAKASNRTL
jgi:hypothetical protein